MGRKKRTVVRNYQKARKPSRQGYGFVAFLGLIIVAFYLWGKVQVNFEYQKNQDLIKKKQALEEDIKQLHIQINSLESYQRITDKALKQGMIFLAPDQIQKLSVNLEGIELQEETEHEKLHIAGFFPDRLKSNMER